LEAKTLFFVRDRGARFDFFLTQKSRLAFWQAAKVLLIVFTIT